MDGFWLLGVESRDFSQEDEKERTACKAGQVHKTMFDLVYNYEKLKNADRT